MCIYEQQLPHSPAFRLPKITVNASQNALQPRLEHTTERVPKSQKVRETFGLNTGEPRTKHVKSWQPQVKTEIETIL